MSSENINNKSDNRNGHARVNDVYFALQGIMKRYNMIEPQMIEFFCPVYYPIAIVEMFMQEKTFEDFDSIQLMILRCFDAGLITPEIISETIGLSKEYVWEITRLLEGLEYVTPNGITDLGREAVQSGKKIVLASSWQKFQIDAINATLLKLDQEIAPLEMFGRSETANKIAHMMYLEESESGEWQNNILNGEREDYIKQKKGILNTNVVSIDDVKFVELKFAKSYMMKLEGYDEILIFVKRQNLDPSRDRDKERYSWMPFSARSTQLRDFLQLDENVVIQGNDCPDTANTIFHKVVEKRNAIAKENLDEYVEEIKNFIKKVVDVKISDKIMSFYKNNSLTVEIKRDRLIRHERRLLDVLYEIAKIGQYINTSEYLYGLIVRFVAADDDIKKLAELVLDYCEKHNGDTKELKTKMDEYFIDYDGDDIYEDMVTFFNSEAD